ncbi:LysE family transporter [Streptomyces sp. NPDC046887]|uniref:LysE family transporter n=1 Tax=Streptomyces sp. NPDC046887 TaxID=3155472 RepID=UPI0033EECAA7
MTELIAVAVITILAVISPGADFAMVVRNSCLYGRTTGLLGAAGVAAGVLVHVTYTMLGVGLIIAANTALFTAIKLLGAAYLVYIGLRTFFARADLTVDLDASGAGLTRLGALRSGFLTNVLNPKTTLFVVSTFTQVVGTETPLWQQGLYGLFMSLAHLGWFALVALFFSHARLRTAMLRAQKALNRAIGGTLVGLGVALGVTSAP